MPIRPRKIKVDLLSLYSCADAGVAAGVVVGVAGLVVVGLSSD